MVFIFKIALFLASVLFLFTSRDVAGAAPLLMVAGALLIWFLDTNEPPRMTAWAALVVGVVMALTKGAGFLVGAVIGAGLILAVDFWARRRGREDPSSISILVALAVAGLTAWLQITAASGALSLGGGTPPERILAVGDSLTSGIPGDSWPRWTDTLETKVSGASVVNLSHPGDTVSESWNRWQRQLEPSRWNAQNPTWSPDLAIIVLGGNDIRRKAPRDRIKEELRTWCRQLQKHNVPILLVSVPGGLVQDEYAGLWEEVAKEFDAGWMNESALRTIFTSPGMTSDGIHFNAKGAEYFADTIARRLTR